tara:strand:- start:115 stop:450 length:336 start_codon:yes stop_codon:yes gene_type:complete
MSWNVKQQVNFYSSEFRPPELAREIRQLIHYGIAGLAFAVVSLIAVLIADLWSEHQLADTRAQVAALNLEIEEVQRQPTPRTEFQRGNRFKTTRMNVGQMLPIKSIFIHPI